jgi:hypothetical protein
MSGDFVKEIARSSGVRIELYFKSTDESFP